MCADKYPESYQYGLLPIQEGSGGASGSPGGKLGGSGGGIIRLQVLNDMTMDNSKILANGGDGKKADGYGSGGGAGGTI